MSGRNRVNHVVRLLALLVLAIIFGYAGLAKLLDPEGAALSVYRYHLVPGVAVNLLALWLGSLELTCAIALLTLRWRKAALELLLGLLVIFTFAIAINLARGTHMACGCFSSSPMAHPVGWLSILKNIGITVLVIHALGGWRTKVSP